MQKNGNKKRDSSSLSKYVEHAHSDNTAGDDGLYVEFDPIKKKPSASKPQVAQVSCDNSLLGSLTKATEALVAAMESKEAYRNPEGKSMRSILREEAEADHKLDHMKFMDKMLEAQAALNLKPGNQSPAIAMAQHQATIVTTTPEIAPNLANLSSQQIQLLSQNISSAPSLPTMQASPLQPQPRDSFYHQWPSSHYQYQRQSLGSDCFQMQYQRPWQSPQFLQQGQFQYAQHLRAQTPSPRSNYESTMRVPDQDQYEGTATPHQIIEGEDDGAYYYTKPPTSQRVRPSHTANSKQDNAQSTTTYQTMRQQQYLQDNMYQPDQRGMSPHFDSSFQQQHMRFQQPTRWGSNQFREASLNQHASSSAPRQNSYSRGK